ncbi:MAG: hypothetical protein HC835_15030 [Oscillatoriales cyanobacterium RM2_1_1]|nr:hypothetical protein [Oscillatoriales cyanobacterium RM2_1_1]
MQQLILWSGLTALLLLFGVFYANRNILLNRSAQKSQPVSQNQPTAQSPSVPQPAPAPEPAQTPIASSGKPSTPQGSNPENDVILKQARAALQDSSASNWSNAIAVASQIPETDSLYATAQQEIERWSQAILDIAQGRASISNYPDAIAAARLVPNENQALYNQAQLQIQQWEQILQQVRNNQAQLKVARDKIKVGDPASYRSAIDAVSSIDPTQPGYAEVKQSIDQWSGAILEIAQAQAKKGRLTQAIESATLVPQNTPSAEAAKTAIAQWQSQLSQPKKN